MQIIYVCSVFFFFWRIQSAVKRVKKTPSGNTLLQLSIQAQNNIRHHECPSTETFQQLSFNEKHNDKPKEKQFTEKQFTTQKGQREC